MMIIFEIFNQFPQDFPVLETLISAFVAFVLGIIWYNPTLLGQRTAEEIEKDTNGFKPGVMAYITGFVLWIFTAAVYSFLTNFLTPPTVSALLGLSTFLWIGFVLPTALLNGLFHGKKLLVIGIDSSYFLAGLYLFAVIHDVLS